MSCSYEVKIRFVDDSYWDDGSRWTSRTFRFDNLKEAVEFAREVYKAGRVVNGLHGTVTTRPSEDDIEVTRISTTRVKWNGS